MTGLAPSPVGTLHPFAQLRPLLAEIGDAKRVRVAGAPGSLAEQAFARTWARLVAGEDVADVAYSETAAAVARARLAGIDAGVLTTAGLSDAEALDVLRRGFDEVAGPLDAELRARLRDALRPLRSPAAAPALAGTLNAQPRAGATAPGRPRIVVEPPESHGDHCLTVAVYGVLVAPVVGADPVAPFLLGVAHHLHNVVLPDAGFAGEVLLGSALDRVLQVHHHARAAAFTASQALDDLELVHAGPVQAYHLDVLAAAGL